MDAMCLSSARAADGRFRAGVSGNPAGRPKGSRNWRTVFLEALREGEGEAIARMAIEAALAGEKRFLFAVFNVLFPKGRGCPLDLGLPEETEAEPLAIYDAALAAMARGDISGVEALDIARVLEKRQRAGREAKPVSDLYRSSVAETVRQRPTRPAAARSAAPASLMGGNSAQASPSPACGGGRVGGRHAHGGPRGVPPSISPRKRGEGASRSASMPAAPAVAVSAACKRPVFAGSVDAVQAACKSPVPGASRAAARRARRPDLLGSCSAAALAA